MRAGKTQAQLTGPPNMRDEPAKRVDLRGRKWVLSNQALGRQGEARRAFAADDHACKGAEPKGIDELCMEGEVVKLLGRKEHRFGDYAIARFERLDPALHPNILVMPSLLQAGRAQFVHRLGTDGLDRRGRPRNKDASLSPESARHLRQQAPPEFRPGRRLIKTFYESGRAVLVEFWHMSAPASRQ